MGIEAIRERPMNTATTAGRLECSGSGWDAACIIQLEV